MNRPTLEVADIIRSAGNRFIQRNRDHLCWPQLKVLRAIRDCRTAALGGHLARCSRCGRQAISYNSCRNRHCPKCQANKRDQWLANRMQDLLPLPLCVLPRYVVSWCFSAVAAVHATALKAT